MEDYLLQLNEQQREAVLYCDGPQLVIAGAGSGKTRVLTYKIVHLLRSGLLPYRIMALTFTNKAAREMRDRITALVGEEIAQQLWMGTFHSVMARILRVNSERVGYRHDFTIYDQADSRSLIKLIVRDMTDDTGAPLDEKLYTPASVQAVVSSMKNALIGPAEYAGHSGLREEDERAGRPSLHRVYTAYCERCRVAGVMDFDDLLYYGNILLRDCPDVLEKYQRTFRYVLVDEYQDTNFAQHVIVQQLTGQSNRMCAVGDDAQSIYSFRGANISNILGLKKFYPDLVIHKLERNYRSTQTIIEAANSLIAHNERQIVKHLFSKNAVGDRLPLIRCYSDYEEAYVVANQIASIKARQGGRYSDFAVLYRTNAQSRALEEAFSNGGRRDKHGNVRHAIPYRVYGGLSFYQRKEIKDAIAYFRLSVNPDDDEALRRVINYPLRGIGNTTVGKIQHSALRHGVSLWHAITHPDEAELAINRGTRKKLDNFVQLIRSFIELTEQRTDALAQAKFIIERTRLEAVLIDNDTPENISRKENLDELKNGIKEFVEIRQEEGDGDLRLSSYLAAISLLTDQDTDTAEADRVTLMTVHAAKGLEFKNVIIVGVEEDLFPSAMSKDTDVGIEEERRLLYVAITRAMTTCTFTYAASRYRNGETKTCQVSRFLREIPHRFLQESATSLASGEPEQWPEFRGFSPSRPTPEPPASPALSAGRSRDEAGSATVPLSKDADAHQSLAGSFVRHTPDELREGQTIVHQRFGTGTIRLVDSESPDARIVVDFPDFGQKTLLLSFAKFRLV